jgi:hypothetical protein
MKRHTPAIVLCLICLVLLLSCRTQPSLPDPRKTGAIHSLPVYDSKGAPVVLDSTKYDSLLSRIIVLENAIYSNPHEVNNLSLLLKASFDSTSGCFLVVGKGTQNKSLPESSWKQGRKIASAYDAKRWALYCKTWSLGSVTPFGTKISGEIIYSRILFERLMSDTLYTLVSIPIGSIIEK